MIASIAFVSVQLNAVNTDKNGFNRIWINNAVIKIKEINGDQLFRISGVNGETLYFSKRNSTQISVYDTSLNYIMPIIMDFDSIAFKLSQSRAVVRYPYAYILAINAPAILRMNLVTREKDVFYLKRGFSKGMPVSEHTVVIRGFDSSYSNMILSKHNLISGSIVEETGIMKRMNDGGFSSDGMILFDQERFSIIYVHYYCNRILLIDTNLNLVHKATTIDTFSSFRAKGSRRPADDIRTSYSFASPPVHVNYNASASAGRILINSAVKADNENIADFNSNAVFDIYSTESGKYLGSFYIPKKGVKRFTDFEVYNDLLIVLNNSKILLYRLKL